MVTARLHLHGTRKACGDSRHWRLKMIPKGAHGVGRWGHSEWMTRLWKSSRHVSEEEGPLCPRGEEGAWEVRRALQRGRAEIATHGRVSWLTVLRGYFPTCPHSPPRPATAPSSGLRAPACRGACISHTPQWTESSKGPKSTLCSGPSWTGSRGSSEHTWLLPQRSSPFPQPVKTSTLCYSFILLFLTVAAERTALSQLALSLQILRLNTNPNPQPFVHRSFSLCTLDTHWLDLLCLRWLTSERYWPSWMSSSF